ncbi:MAG: NAD(P)-dependent alcohol dehydrogenase [Alkalinema sp. RU_4_3]|nr:NAD(P)-dependent alcohol dehydrogenase [Alkalinema sp. RU_4_3]
MKAIVQTRYGSPEVMQLAEVEAPTVPDNGVLVKVHATSINSGDWRLMRGTPFLVRLMFGGLRKPKIKTLGMDVSGTVEAVGRSVTQFKPGDAVFGDTSEAGFGSFAEYLCAPEATFAHKPAQISFEAAATVPVAALTALQGLRDCGQIQAGQKVLINGASSGVGTFAVQLAKAFGAEVTAVCSREKSAMVVSLGADQMIDYHQTDITKMPAQYDLIFDVAAYRSVYHYLPILKPQGTYVLVGGAIERFFQLMLFGPWISRRQGKSIKVLSVKPNQADLVVLSDLLEAGKIVPVIDRTYPLSQVPAAIHQMEQRQVTGKIAIAI